MPIDDLWYLKERGPDKKRLKSRRYGRGKRWRVRYIDAAGGSRERLFDRKTDAEAFDLEARTGAAPETQLNQADQRTTYREYAERWRLSRSVGQALDYQRHLDSRLRHHHYPHFGDRPIRSLNVTDILEWIAKLIAGNAAQLSIRTYFDVFNNVMNAALADKVILHNPCQSIKISTILRGLSLAPKWVPTTDQVVALLDVVPPNFRLAILLGAGEGTRLGEVLGMEAGDRCVDDESGVVHVVQQLRFHRSHYGGFYLAPPKSGSVGDVDLDDAVSAAYADHVRDYPPVAVDLVDITRGTPDPGKPPTRRVVRLLFTDDQGRPIHDQAWARLWRVWRDAAGWPVGATFHSLRHYFATLLIASGADPVDVQKALRHAGLRTTLETYVHWWPKKNRRRNVVGSALAGARRELPGRPDRA
ncbi:site-specific integrase [Actinoplanes sp. NPDC049118]|uniref:tyrosine-type recombinase/integrase n=1 Tax=Actinoplanes sp. NPDC049118 TaxID=3155769 RepID=UPI0033F3BFD4